MSDGRSGTLDPSCFDPLLDLKLELVDLAEQRFEQRRSVGLAVAENQINQGWRAVEGPADQSGGQHVANIERQQAHSAR